MVEDLLRAKSFVARSPRCSDTGARCCRRATMRRHCCRVAHAVRRENHSGSCRILPQQALGLGNY
jgi:hypothetical protein